MIRLDSHGLDVAHEADSVGGTDIEVWQGSGILLVQVVTKCSFVFGGR